MPRGVREKTRRVRVPKGQPKPQRSWERSKSRLRRSAISGRRQASQNPESSDYKHVALGLIFLKHISNAFEAKHTALLAEDPTTAEDPDEYLAEHVFWVPQEARQCMGIAGNRASGHLLKRYGPWRVANALLSASAKNAEETIKLRPVGWASADDDFPSNS